MSAGSIKRAGRGLVRKPEADHAKRAERMQGSVTRHATLLMGPLGSLSTSTTEWNTVVK